MKTETKKISIILPIYNTEKYLGRCLESLINQTYKNIEILAIDDGSKDNSLLICKEYIAKDSRIKLYHKENGGVSSARNLGLKMLTGDYVVFVDSDDWVEQNYIEKMHEQIQKTNVDIVKFNLYIETSKGKEKIKDDYTKFENKILNKKQIDEKVLPLFLSNNLQAYLPTFIFTKNIVKNVWFKEGICMMEDTVFLIKILLKAKNIKFNNEPYYHYMLNETSASNNGIYLKRNLKNLYEVNTILDDYLKSHENYTKYKKILNTSHVCILESYFYLFYKNKQIDNAIFFLSNKKYKGKFYDIYSNADISKIKLVQKIPLYLIVKNGIMQLKFFYFTKSKVSAVIK